MDKHNLSEMIGAKGKYFQIYEEERMNDGGSHYSCHTSISHTSWTTLCHLHSPNLMKSLAEGF